MQIDNLELLCGLNGGAYPERLVMKVGTTSSSTPPPLRTPPNFSSLLPYWFFALATNHLFKPHNLVKGISLIMSIWHKINELQSWWVTDEVASE